MTNLADWERFLTEKKQTALYQNEHTKVTLTLSHGITCFQIIKCLNLWWRTTEQGSIRAFSWSQFQITSQCFIMPDFTVFFSSLSLSLSASKIIQFCTFLGYTNLPLNDISIIWTVIDGVPKKICLPRSTLVIIYRDMLYTKPKSDWQQQHYVFR